MTGWEIALYVFGVLAIAALVAIWFMFRHLTRLVDSAEATTEKAVGQVIDLQAELANEIAVAHRLRAELDGHPVSNIPIHHRVVPNAEYLSLVRKAEVFNAWAATEPGNTIHELTDPTCTDKANQPAPKLQGVTRP